MNNMYTAHAIMCKIYNLTSDCKDYDFYKFEKNRRKLADLLDFADNTLHSLIITNKNDLFTFKIIKGKNNYIFQENTLFEIHLKCDKVIPQDMMKRLNKILNILRDRLEANNIFSIEENRGFEEKEINTQEYPYNIENNVNEILGEDGDIIE